jgi:hypothetical protein
MNPTFSFDPASCVMYNHHPSDQSRFPSRSHSTYQTARDGAVKSELRLGGIRFQSRIFRVNWVNSLQSSLPHMRLRCVQTNENERKKWKNLHFFPLCHVARRLRATRRSCAHARSHHEGVKAEHAHTRARAHAKRKNEKKKKKKTQSFKKFSFPHRPNETPKTKFDFLSLSLLFPRLTVATSERREEPPRVDRRRQRRSGCHVGVQRGVERRHCESPLQHALNTHTHIHTLPRHCGRHVSMGAPVLVLASTRITQTAPHAHIAAESERKATEKTEQKSHFFFALTKRFSFSRSARRPARLRAARLLNCFPPLADAPPPRPAARSSRPRRRRTRLRLTRCRRRTTSASRTRSCTRARTTCSPTTT